MPLVTPQQLENAAEDCSSLEDVVNGAADLNGDGTTTTRLGMVLKTIARIFQEITTIGGGWLADAEAAAVAAEGYMNQAAQYASSGLYQNLIELDYSDSPYVPDSLQEGSLFMFDTSGGNIVVNLDTLSSYGEDMKFAFVKTTNDANTITINRGGSDAINAGTNYVITAEFVITAIVGGYDTAQWITSVQATGVPAGSVDNAKLANMVQATIKGRNAGAGTGSPSDLTVAQVTAMLDAMVGDAGSGGTKGLVPAPASGDAAAGKVLGAGGVWVVVQGVPVGTTIEFNGTSAPSGYLEENGAAISRITYAALFTAIGTTHGAGDGSTTFNLPDSRRRVAVGVGGTSTAQLGNTVGAVGGAETIALTGANNGAHTHTLGSTAPTGVIATTSSGGSGQISTTGGSMYIEQNATINSSGSGTAHDNIQPSIVKMKCIKY